MFRFRPVERRCIQLVGAGLAVLTLACARRPEAGETITPRPPVPLTVESRHPLDVVVFVARGGQRQRLGTVISNTSGAFIVPSRYASDAGGFVLLADPIGAAGQPYSSDLVYGVARDQRVVWTLEATLSRSTIAIFPDYRPGPDSTR